MATLWGLALGCFPDDWKLDHHDWVLVGEGLIRPSTVPSSSPHIPAADCKLPGVNWWCHKLQASTVLPGNWALGISVWPPDYDLVDSGHDILNDQTCFYWASARTLRIPLPCPPEVRAIYVNMDGLDFDIYDDLLIRVEAVGVDATSPWAQVRVFTK